jgi:acetylornithine deacetylase
LYGKPDKFLIFMHNLLINIISIPAFSGEEGARADFIAAYLAGEGLTVERVSNNLWARVRCGRNDAQTVMLNSHIDTVRPSAGYTFDPFNPDMAAPQGPHADCRRARDAKRASRESSPPPGDSGLQGSQSEPLIRGLGSNDAGGAVVAMIAATLHFARHGGLNYDLLLLLSAEEERSGKNGMSLAIGYVGTIDCAIIGEPTGMRAAIAERGLLVLYGVAHGVSGHAARGEGDNAIYRAMSDIDALRTYKFTKKSPVMGLPTLAVTQINAGSQHNVVPDRCEFVVDIRPTDVYSNEQIFNELQAVTQSTLTSRSLTNRSSATPPGHPLMKAAERLGIERYVSPTTSDWMRVGAIPAVKMGPGDSARSHAADEYITVEELNGGIEGYIKFLEALEL